MGEIYEAYKKTPTLLLFACTPKEREREGEREREREREEREGGRGSERERERERREREERERESARNPLTQSERDQILVKYMYQS